MLIANLIGVFFFLYFYWRRLKEDYQTEKIFNAGFILIIGVCVGIVLATYLLPNNWFWIIATSLFVAQLIVVYKLKLKPYESFEALIISSLPWLALCFLANSIQLSSLTDFLRFWLSLTSIFLFFLFDNFYRTFFWYKSGRIGFSGLATLGIFFLVNLLFPASYWDKIFSGTVVFLSFLLLYNLSKQDD